MKELSQLPTEARNPATESLDGPSTLELTKAMHHADWEAVAAVEKELPRIAGAIDAIVARLEHGGRLFYLGAGTSGRLGVLDASECPPTFNTPPELVQGVIAGGDRALRWAVERAEDDPEQGRKDLTERGFCGRDALVSIAASGRTPYVLGAIGYARELGSLVIGISCVPGSAVSQLSDTAITPVVGPEVITGSTRMRA